ncbi:3-oxoacyl-ACP synthase III family protein [Actinoplanes teichomyceticus]|uniref:3-oxoacyl-[acyl-carrier-protein] synthase-3 n=1 Tax=Actinoplanes teichomyceticus TaxID=1867 RepID=A0A561WBG3_ACTTI|nr:ketoacyl-ACP synthase III [Actinoplanes teichomyceticus]TWG21206.1 3-oxoacyl-[acyl-carrier-protein] synthase-3 [Actinoplanes teichomyceticus]GIF15027.1 3-oxoacyl-[acyl-carrier-protein] synthase 3 [Actinoplanes teichomyceticus]
MSVDILGTGSYLPERVVTNAEIEELVPAASAEWIESRTGILERRYAAPGEAASDLAVHAARAALEQAGLAAGELDYVIVATTTGDTPVPATASFVQGALGAGRAACFDINMACAGFVAGLAIAQAFVARRPGARALVVGVDLYTRFVDFTDRATSVLFGDGAGAAVVGRRPDRPGAARGLLDVDLLSDADSAGLITTPAGGSRLPASARTVAEAGHTLHMQGRAVKEFVLANVPQFLTGLVKRCGHGPADVDHFVPHQANGMLVRALADASGLGDARLHLPVRYSGNIGAASVPVALDQANRGGALRDGDLVLLAGFGAGMAVGAGLLRWSGTGGGA